MVRESGVAAAGWSMGVGGGQSKNRDKMAEKEREREMDALPPSPPFLCFLSLSLSRQADHPVAPGGARLLISCRRTKKAEKS